MIKKPAPVLSDCHRRNAPIRTSSEKGIELTSPYVIDPDQEPWNLARRFTNRLSDALGDTLRDVVVGSASLGDWQANSDIDQYWRNRIILSEQIYLNDEAAHPVSTFEVEWMSLGPARLLATVLTGRIVSKSEGGEPASGRSPEFRRHLTQVLDTRRGSDTTRTWSREDLERSLDLARICVRLGAGG